MEKDRNGGARPFEVNSLTGFAGATDCHAHLLGPFALHPLPDMRDGEPPEEAPLDVYRDVLANELGFTQAVLVQPRAYGTDNECLLQALARHRNKLRGIATAEPGAGDEALERLAGTGVRGLRFCLDGPEDPLLNDLPALAARIEPMNWHFEFDLDGRHLPALYERLAGLPVPCVFDHLALLRASEDLHSTSLGALIRLIENGTAWVKLTGIERLSDAGPPYDDMKPLVRRLVETDPTRLLWGSGWPYCRGQHEEERHGIAAAALARFALWVPEERLRRLILAANPALLYGFNED